MRFPTRVIVARSQGPIPEGLYFSFLFNRGHIRVLKDKDMTKVRHDATVKNFRELLTANIGASIEICVDDCLILAMIQPAAHTPARELNLISAWLSIGWNKIPIQERSS